MKLPNSIFLVSRQKREQNINGYKDINDHFFGFFIINLRINNPCFFVAIKLTQNKSNVDGVNDVAIEQTNENQTSPSSIPAASCWLDDDAHTRIVWVLFI